MKKSFKKYLRPITWITIFSISIIACEILLYLTFVLLESAAIQRKYSARKEFVQSLEKVNAISSIMGPGKKFPLKKEFAKFLKIAIKKAREDSIEYCEEFFSEKWFQKKNRSIKSVLFEWPKITKEDSLAKEMEILRIKSRSNRLKFRQILRYVR